MFHKKQSTEYKSDIPIDIFIPTVSKDFELLKSVIFNLRKNINHPINNIYIASNPNDQLSEFCSANKVVFVNESEILGYGKEHIKYIVDKTNRSGWLYQQLLKLNADQVCSQENFLIFDSDTLLNKPQAFIVKDKFIFNISDEFHEPYGEFIEKLRLFKRSPFSFISHHMIFNKTILADLKKAIGEKFGERWDEAILKNIDLNEPSAFSEYELYGNFVRSQYPGKYYLEYWDNISLSRQKFNEYDSLFGNAKTISFHSYNQ